MCVDKGIEAYRRQCRTAQLHTIPQVFKNRMLDLHRSKNKKANDK